MQQILPLLLFAFAVLSAQHVIAEEINVPDAGDRGHQINMVYPEEAFIEQGGPVIDITKPPYNARGGGDPADADHNTEAFVAVYDFIMSELDKYGDMDDGVVQPHSTEASYIIYIPDGTYYVNDTLIYSGPIRAVAGAAREYSIWLRLFGQSRENTVIRLADGSSGFNDKDAPKPIVAFSKKEIGGVNPMKANNAISNMTICAGSNNPGAIGILWTSANNGIANELLITSEDGGGFSGYDFTIGGPCGYFRDIVVEGYDYGIRIGTHARRFYNPVLEYVTLRDQREAGILCESGSGTLRKIYSDNTVPAVMITDAYSHAVVLDSKFTGGQTQHSAIEITDVGHGVGHLFARNIEVDGYAGGVSMMGERQVEGGIREYVSGEITTFGPDVRPASLNLPIEEVPYVPWEQDMSKWVAAPSGSNAQTIQEAISDTSKSVLYFPGRDYNLGGTIEVPSHIKVIDFMFSDIAGVPAFRVSEDADEPIHFRNLCKARQRGRVFIEHDSPRTVHTELVPGRYGNPGNHPGSKAFLCSSTIARSDMNYPLSNVTLFIRWVNDEYREQLFEIGENSQVVILGYKTEGGGIGFTIEEGSKVEILGGVNANHGRPLWYTEPYPYVKNNGGQFSISTRFMQGGRTYETYIHDAQAEETKVLPAEHFPELGTGRSQDRIIPLYVSGP